MGDNSSSSIATPKRTVLITGFGPFATHSINASWESVKELQKIGIRDDVRLVAMEIPVEYSAVDEIIPSVWKEHKPELVVHVGVSGVAKDLTFEQRAHNDGYDKFDVCGLLPCECCCKEGAPLCLVSEIDMNQVCVAVNKSDCNVHSVVSNDPGRYLCDYIYFTSLNINRSCVAFIHVPPLDQPYSAKQLADAIRIAVMAMLDQLAG